MSDPIETTDDANDAGIDDLNLNDLDLGELGADDDLGGEGGDGGGQGGEQQQQQGGDAPTGSKNPALLAFYEKLVGKEGDPDSGLIPMSLRPHLFDRVIKPELEKWQQGVDARFEQFAPYQPLIEQRVPIEAIQAGLQLLDWGRNDIGALLKEVYEAAKQKGVDPNVVLGITPQQAADAAAASAAGAGNDDDDLLGVDDDLAKNPIVQALQRQVQELSEGQQAVIAERQRAEALSAIDATVKALEKEHKGGGFNREAIIRRAILIQSIIPEDRPVTAEQLVRAAYEEWNKERIDILRSAAKRPPRLGGGTTRVPGEQGGEKKPLTEDERRAKIIAMAEAAARGENID